MRIFLWHGYLLGGTGSNVYTRALARAWRRLGHDVVVFCQEPHPELYDLGDATVVRPDLAGGPLPVFVLDRYEDVEARYLHELSWGERRRFIDVNAAAVRSHLPADFLLANHVLLGAPVGAAVGIPFGVKAHGSELEFSLRGNEELCAWARDTLGRAEEVYAGSDHIRRVLEEVVGPGDYLSRVRVVPPGVDTDELKPEARSDALRGLLEEARRDPPNPGRRRERLPDPGNARRLADALAGDEPVLVYVGKLSREKGVELLVRAVSRLPRGTLIVVGFGPERIALEDLARRLFPDEGKKRIVFTGPLEHRHLKHLWPLACVSVTPSVFPEAFGMVAAEAAACGAPPLVARHSGLASIAEGLEAEYPAGKRSLASFETGSVDELAAKLHAIVTLPPDEWRQLSAAARRAAEKNWGWERIAALLLSTPWERRSA